MILKQNKLFALCIFAGAAFAALCLEIISTNTATVDEFAHVPAGVSHWETGDFSLYHENPPFVRCLVSLPVWLSDPLLNYRKAIVGEGLRSEWLFGVDFLVLNLENYGRLLFKARCVVLTFSLLCCGLIFLWAGREYGRPAACVGALLWLTDPNVVAHSGIATLDVAASAFGCLAAYVFWRFLRSPVWSNAILSGVCLGLALASKFSLMALCPAFGVAFLYVRAMRHATDAVSTPVHVVRPSWAQAFTIAALSLTILDACYLFNGVGRRLDSFDFESRLLSGDDPRAPGGNRFRGTVLGRFPVPLPEDFVTGFDSQKRDEEARLANLGSGGLTHGGPWYGPLRTLALKLPLGTIVILGWTAMYWIRGGLRISLSGVVLTGPPLIILGMLCTQTGLNWAFRYTLTALPFLFIASGPMVRAAWSAPASRLLIALCLAWNVVEVANARPFYLSYGNQLAGGMRGARRTFLGSNCDWGQDLDRLRMWFAANEGKARRTFVLFYGPIDVRLWGVSGRVGFPDAATKGQLASAPPGAGPLYFAVSSNYLNGLPGSYMTLDGQMRTGQLVVDPGAGRIKLEERIGSTVLILKVDDYEGQIYVGDYDSTGKVFGTP